MQARNPESRCQARNPANPNLEPEPETRTRTSKMNIGYPQYLIWLLLILPGLGLLYWFYYRNKDGVRKWFSPGEYLFSGPFLKLILRGATFVLLFPALLGFYVGRSEQEIQVQSRETFILMDVSASMHTEDLQPSRLEKMKAEITRYIDHMKGDRIGLIVFTSNAYLQCPLTEDHSALKLYLEIAGSGQFANSGTDFRPPLAMAYNSLKRSADRKPNLSRSIIFISDGEDFGDRYESVIDRLLQYEIKVFPVGVGTYKGGPVPNFVEGEKDGFKKAADGSLAVSQLVDDDLQELAEVFGTRYHRIQSQFDTLEPVEEQIRLLSTATADKRKEVVENNIYFVFVGISAILLLVSMVFMPIRKPPSA